MKYSHWDAWYGRPIGFTLLLVSRQHAGPGALPRAGTSVRHLGSRHLTRHPQALTPAFTTRRGHSHVLRSFSYSLVDTLAAKRSGGRSARTGTAETGEHGT